MKKLLLICSLFATMNLQAFELPCFRKAAPKANPIEKRATRVAPKAALETSEETADAFTLVDTVAGGTNPDFLTYSHNGRFAAVTNGGDNTVSVYSVDCETGTFTEIAGSPFATGVYPSSIAYSPCDNYAAVTNAPSTSPTATDYTGDSISVYSVNCETGALTLIQTLTNATNPEIVTPFSIAYSPDGRFAAVANYDNVDSIDNIAIYRVSPITGKLTLSTTVDESGQGPISVVYSPNGKFAAVALHFTSTGSTFQVDPVTGNFFNPQPFAAGALPFGIAYSHNGKFAAIANYASNAGTVRTYFVNPVTGVFILSFVKAPTMNTNQTYVAFSRDDSLLAVTNTGTGTVTVYCVDPNSAVLTQTQTVDNLPPVTLVTNFEASGISFAPCSDFAAVTSFGGDTVSVFSVEEEVCP